MYTDLFSRNFKVNLGYYSFFLLGTIQRKGTLLYKDKRVLPKCAGVLMT